MFRQEFSKTDIHGRSGFTLVEIMISVMLFSIAIVAIFEMMSSGINVHAAATAVSDIETQAQRALDRIVEEVQQGDRSRMWAPAPQDPGCGWLNYRRYEGYDGGTIQWSCDDMMWTNMAFGLWDAPGEWGWDGIDNNRNGVIDELVLKRIEWDALWNMEEQTIAHWVKGYDYATQTSVEGLSFHMDADRLMIRLEMQKLDGKGNLIQSVVETDVTIRNDSEEL